VKITYLNKREGEKQFRGVIWGQKLTLSHPSLVDEGEEIRVSADGSQKREGETPFIFIHSFYTSFFSLYISLRITSLTYFYNGKCFIFIFMENVILTTFWLSNIIYLYCIIIIYLFLFLIITSLIINCVFLYWLLNSCYFLDVQIKLLLHNIPKMTTWFSL